MLRLNKSILIAFLMLLIPTMLYAACTGSSPMLYAASASRDDVAACVDVATYGDQINIPSGTEPWSEQINITKNIIINGNGSGSTILIDNFSTSPVSFFNFTPDATARSNIAQNSSGIFEIKNIGFTGARVVNRFGITLYNISTPVSYRIRIHHCAFTSIHRAVNITGYINGVFDNNYLYGTNGAYPEGVGYNGFANDRRSIGGSNGWYIEDNVFDFAGTTGLMFGAVNDGYSGVVMRYNTATGTMGAGANFWEVHGNQSSYVYGPQSTEVYGNNIFGTTPGKGAVIRGGKNIVFNNVFNDAYIVLWEEYSDLITSETYPANKCPENQGVSRQMCLDSCVCQKIHDTYFWNNRPTVTGNNVEAVVTMDYEERMSEEVNVPLEIVENTEFFNYDSYFNGTTGVGCGTLANRPATCTTGVAYWATTQDCSNLSGMVGANPTTPISGTLYICGATGWNDGTTYTPYTYPHPLRGPTVQKFTGNIMIGGAGLFN